jgi:hypothetical protein
MNVDTHTINDGNDQRERNKQYAITKINRLIKELQDILDNKIDEELRLGFFNLSCCLEHWIIESVHMSKVIENNEKKQKRIERLRKNGISFNDDENNLICNSPSY